MQNEQPNIENIEIENMWFSVFLMFRAASLHHDEPSKSEKIHTQAYRGIKPVEIIKRNSTKWKKKFGRATEIPVALEWLTVLFSESR